MEWVRVKVEDPLQDDVSSLLAQSDAVAAVLYPGEYRRPITSESLAKPGTHVFVARLFERAVGLCVLFDRLDGTMELKRMIMAAGERGTGIGVALLQEAESQAVSFGARTMLLEVGVRNVEAHQLYVRSGYQLCGPFQPYCSTPISRFMCRSLTGKASLS